MSNAIVTRHSTTDGRCRIITFRARRWHPPKQKMVYLKVDDIHVVFPEKVYQEFKIHQTELKIGHFVDFSILPTCGLATPQEVVEKQMTLNTLWIPSVLMLLCCGSARDL